ncbi:MAG TPA: sulfite exporter TauE/SafE family protein [Puia sp.]|nr:sulfite exporter TauE/SafE family protein [Puia sp.]
MWPSLLVAFSIGLVSSAHCVAMCGPLVLAMPLQALRPARRRIAVMLYHGGRIGVYAFAGLVFGMAGRAVYVAGDQQGLSILLGAAILAQLLFRHYGARGWMPGWLASGYRGLQQWMHRWWASPSIGKFLLLGIGNGLLPCSMVYLAVAGALTMTGPVEAMTFMILFGLGTLPLLLALQVAGRMAGAGVRQRMRRLIPVVTAAVGVLLILRGMNLGIPLVSPAMAASPGVPIGCH